MAVLVCILLVVAALQAQRRANDAIAADQAQYDELMARVGRTPESGIDRINDQVAQDAVDQYWIAKRQGDAVQICAQASLVVAGFLQAKNEKKYVHWKDVEEMDCRIANSQ